jgi:hypothetical protein
MSTAVMMGSAGIATALLLLHYSQNAGPMMTVSQMQGRVNEEHLIARPPNSIHQGNRALGNALDPLITGYFPGNSPDAAAEELQCRLQTLQTYGQANSEYGLGRCYFNHMHPEDVASC